MTEKYTAPCPNYRKCGGCQQCDVHFTVIACEGVSEKHSENAQAVHQCDQCEQKAQICLP